ncbi:hypothetical protein BGZ61DRAFT_449122 [Ilyonectria robusta]|uniref:uncharacterized protein n=1 Tax=Ilyonectria robusta TaxID=1079257 RepID=UPI001E8E8931|nr:uncharacterized protein BGZ61DRAFT_449122 [Ilyonectria robusta]KAH6977285.1 hypothetical protein BKA56DRAFT_588052 [Ilyonectria sp. MPI-CAGE-AT-0026]KAH8714491.1 hypothetical protein BGZ61DRAFT_449122 [Ilyonectria robusta]
MAKITTITVHICCRPPSHHIFNHLNARPLDQERQSINQEATGIPPVLGIAL